MGNENYDIVLFDGVCNLCNGAVKFIIQHDKNVHFKFASLQSAFAEKILQQYKIEINNPPQSILLISDNKVFDQSSAIFHIAQKLDGAWKAAAIFLIIPKFIRDAVYNLIARNRYKWFGQKKECWLPTPELKARFLD